MRVVLTLIGALVANLFKSPHRLEVENLFLRHQLSIALRRAPHRVHLRGCDRALLVWLTWFWQACSVCPAWFSRRRSCGGIALGCELSTTKSARRRFSASGISVPKWLMRRL